MLEQCLAKLTEVDLELTKEWLSFWKVVIPSLVTLFAVYLAYLFATKQARKKRTSDFTEKQLTEFYSPIHGCIRKIRAYSNLRLELSGASNNAWLKICERQPKPFLDHDKYFEPFKKLIEYDNKQLSEDLIPLYDRAVEIFTNNYWLAENSTKQYYEELCRFVEIWHRYLSRSLPGETLQEIEHTEERLYPFYKDLEDTINKLKGELKAL